MYHRIRFKISCNLPSSQHTGKNDQFIKIKSNLVSIAINQIYTVEWNTFLPNVFISCAAEWSVKIWDMNNTSPLYTFDVKAPTGDVAWAPYSRYLHHCK